MNEERLEVRIRNLFDFQRFAGNARLGRLISETESRYRNNDNIVMLSDRDLEMVNAAGEIDVLRTGSIRPIAMSDELKIDVHAGVQDGGEGK